VAAAFAYQTAAREREYRALLARGDAALGREDTFGAIEAYSGALALRPDSMLAHLRRGQTYRRRGDLDAARRDFRQAAELDPTAIRPLEELADVLYQMGRFQRAGDVYDRGLRLDDRSARLAYKLALARYRWGRIDVALATVSQAILLDDTSAEAHYLMGLCLDDKGQRREAQRSYERAVALAPGFVAAREELADLLGARRQFGDQLSQLQVIAGLDRDRLERQVDVGLAQARSGRADAAVLTLGAALDRAPDDPRLYTALGRVWLEDAEARDDRVALSKALEALAPAAANPAATSEALTLYGRALLRDEQIEAAERHLHQATERYPVEPTSFLHYASAAERLGRFEAARQALVDYGSLVASDPRLASRTLRIASLSLELNEPRTAIRWLQQALASHGADIRLIGLLAEAQLRAGDRERAEATVARGLELDPANEELLALRKRF
jgi:Flp pilus assembly protein TadD